MFVASKDGEMGELLLNKTKLEAALSTTVDADILVRINEVVDTALNFSDVTREVISRFIEKIEVKANGTVKLFYRFAGSSTVLNELIV
jgi:site-specific DNA recombinase